MTLEPEGQKLFGVRVFVDSERTITSKHHVIISANGVHQCLECGHWTKGVIWLLDKVECVETDQPVEVLL